MEKKQIKFFIIIIIIFIIIIIIGIGYNYFNSNKRISSNEITTTKENLSEEIVVNLTINYNEQQEIFNNIKMKKNSSVFDLLKKATEDNGVGLAYKDYGGDMGVFIESINDVENNPEKNLYWQYLVNGNFANVGASQQKLNNGDLIEWKYAESSF